jgi:hypothetical protein
MRCFSILLLCVLGVSVSADPIAYKGANGIYVVVVEQGKGMSAEETQESALKSASEVAQKNQCPHYTIKNQQWVQVASTQNPPAQNPSPSGNLSYGMMQGSTPNKDQLQGAKARVTTTVPAYQVTIQCE